ncbi:MAG TPA: hypothetical protein VFZ42_02540 [Chitinophagaceae bacterium]
MKVVHSDKAFQSVEELLSLARQHEQDDDKEEAIALYLKILKRQPLNALIYDRLMILYRKTKESKKELDIIKAGIKTFEEFYNKREKAPPAKVARLSAALSKATGLVDKKGKSLYAPEPLGRWERRRLLVEKKLNQPKKRRT